MTGARTLPPDTTEQQPQAFRRLFYYLSIVAKPLVYYFCGRTLADLPVTIATCPHYYRPQ